ncbi:MAG: NAD(P)-binding domain-containing protein [Acidobacteriaceae bacterium]
MRNTEVAIVGAGPYGLSLAAHLKAAGVPFRIVGRPMETWQKQMPQGMLLKSDGFASNLSDPAGAFELHHFCAERGIAYDPTRVPVALDTFCAYGLEFQRRLLPELEERQVTALEHLGDSYRLRLDDGEVFTARKVVLAVGISHYAYTPEVFAGLPSTVFSHSSALRDLSRFAGKSVAIVGSGASALDLAALLHEVGAEVQVLARRKSVKFHDVPTAGRRPLLARLRSPGSGVGPGWKSRLCTDLPHLFRLLPLGLRLEIVRRHLGPSAGWPIKARVVGKVPIATGVTPERAELREGGVRLHLHQADGGSVEVDVDQVVAATGYRVDLRRLKFLDDTLREKIRSAEGAPLLSAHFEASVPGLYFTGISAATSFGPVMRFAFGAAWTAKRMERHLARRAQREGLVHAEPMPA